MSYFIFDMDETLAELYSVYYFIATLKNDEEMPESLKKSLDDSYKIFVEKVLNKEKSNEPLGILRPGILEIMKQLSNLQKQGKVKNVVIYSNNGHLESLYFIRDLIHLYVKSNNLIKECIHWDHPMRKEEINGRPGAANKTWNVLKNILVKGNCVADPDLKAEDVYFFDDLDHTDLKRNLGINYYQVPGYNFKASINRLSQIFRESTENINKNDMEILKNNVIKRFAKKNNDINTNSVNSAIEIILNIFKNNTKGTMGDNVYPPLSLDEGIKMMLQAIDRISSFKGGKRNYRLTKKKRTKKSRIKMHMRKSQMRKN